MAQPLICGAYQSSHLRCQNVVSMLALGVRFIIRFRDRHISNPAEKCNGCDDCQDYLSVTGASCEIMYLLVTPHAGGPTAPFHDRPDDAEATKQRKGFIN